MQSLLKLQKPLLSNIWQWMRSSLAQDQNSQKKRRERKKKNTRKDRRRKRRLLSSTRRRGNANFFFWFFCSPSRVESHNTRTTAMRKLTRQQGEQWLWKLKQSKRAKKELAPRRPLQQSRAHKTLRPPDLCRKQTGEVVIMWSMAMFRSEKFQYDFDLSV